MDIESYFERVADDEVLIRGTRVDVTTVLDAYREGLSPEEIAYNFPTLSLEQVYATLTYHLAQGATFDEGIQRGDPTGPPASTSPEAAVVLRLHAIASARRARPIDEKTTASR